MCVVTIFVKFEKNIVGAVVGFSWDTICFCEFCVWVERGETMCVLGLKFKV